MFCAETLLSDIYIFLGILGLTWQLIKLKETEERHCLNSINCTSIVSSNKSVLYSVQSMGNRTRYPFLRHFEDVFYIAHDVFFCCCGCCVSRNVCIAHIPWQIGIPAGRIVRFISSRLSQNLYYDRQRGKKAIKSRCQDHTQACEWKEYQRRQKAPPK